MGLSMMPRIGAVLEVEQEWYKYEFLRKGLQRMDFKVTTMRGASFEPKPFQDAEQRDS